MLKMSSPSESLHQSDVVEEESAPGTQAPLQESPYSNNHFGQVTVETSIVGVGKDSARVLGVKQTSSKTQGRLAYENSFFR